MSDRFDVEFLEPGDSFEGGPIEQSYFISAVMGAGGEVEIEGNIVTVFSLPGKNSANFVEDPEALLSQAASLISKYNEITRKKGLEPISEDSVTENPKVSETPVEEEYPLVDMAAEEVVAEEPSKPKYSRKPKPPAPKKCRGINTMAIAPRGILVKTPRCTEPPKYGIVSSVEPVRVTDDHWMASGIEWEDFLCGENLEAFIDECPPASGFTKPAERNNLFCYAEPFVVVGSYDCSLGGRRPEEGFEIARQRLLAWESKQVEEAFWTGVANDSSGGLIVLNSSLAFGNTSCEIEPIDLTPDDGVGPVEAIAILESALGEVSPCGGVIHAPYFMAAFLVRYNLIKLIGDSYFTPTGVQVILGHGYHGSGPDGVDPDPGTTWMFATGPIVMARSDVMMVPGNVPEAVNRLNNNITVRAERFYAVGYSCVNLAVNVRLCANDCPE